MNILIPHKWLLEHLQTKAKPTKIQELLSLSGPSVEKIVEIEGDQVYDIEITTNRPDALSVRGVAKEAAVILTQYQQPAKLKELKKVDIERLETDALPLPIINNNPALCRRILCVVLDQVKQKPTPNWMAKRLIQAGYQTHNSLIDITNYITHDLGHPCHAFDYDKIMELGGVINVEEALPNRPFTTLDNQDRLTVGGEIIFTNTVGTIIDLPAIMGTANSSIDAQTRRVLLWLEDLDSHKVRQASMAHAIRTIAAQLNEKELDPYLGETTLHQAIKLYREVTGAKLASPVYDQFITPKPQKNIVLDYQQLTDYLGFELELDRAKEILEELGCQVSIKLKSKHTPQAKLLVKPPSYRLDLQIGVDLIEEIARIYGYQNIPSALMTGSLPLNPPADIDFALEHRIKQFLADIGWQEIYSLSLVSEQLAKDSHYPLSDHLKLINPLLTENSILRRSLLPSLKEAHEANPQQTPLSLFEIAAVYQPQSHDQPKEIMRLGMLSNKPYRQVRGDVEALLEQFFIDNVDISPIETKNSDNQEAEIRIFDPDSTINKTPLQDIGKLQILNANLIGIELDIKNLTHYAKKHPAYQPLAHTTPIIEDLTFTLLLDTCVGKVIEVIRDSSQLIKKVELIDHFQQNHTFRIHYQHDQKNLSTQDILPIRQKVVEMVEKTTNSKLVGRV